MRPEDSPSDVPRQNTSFAGDNMATKEESNEKIMTPNDDSRVTPPELPKAELPKQADHGLSGCRPTPSYGINCRMRFARPLLKMKGHGRFSAYFWAPTQFLSIRFPLA